MSSSRRGVSWGRPTRPFFQQGALFISGLAYVSWIPLSRGAADSQRSEGPQGVPSTASAQPGGDGIPLMERQAEPLYQKALHAANDPAVDASSALDAIQAALGAGACATRTLTEGAFAKYHTTIRFREMIRDHMRQWSISMMLPGEPGERLHVSGVVLGPENEPVKGALVYVFHTDASGHYAPQSMNESSPRLFGFMRTDESGRFAFTTIRPGHYPDQTEPVEQHIHGEVTAPGYKPRMLRIGFADDSFWLEQKRVPPYWALPVTRGPDGVAACQVNAPLERN